MDRWIYAETHRRREELFDYAARVRQIRQAEGDRSTSIRGALANGAQAISDALEHFAYMLRENEA